MNNFKVISLTLLTVFSLQACNDKDSKPNAVEEVIAPTTIVDVAVANGNFTTLVAALQATNLDTTLADTSSKFTVFAPTDDAFALLGQDTIDALLADTDKLSDILTYHVISGEVNSTTAIGLAGTTVDMVNGDAIGLSLNGDNLLVNTATVVTADIQTDNGIIHVIDAVLLPPEDMAEPTANIVETAVAAGDFTTLVSVLQATNLDTVLADESATFTVFAPTDAAFALNSGPPPPGASKLVVLAAGATGAAPGLGLVLAAQLVQAQVATAINTGQILEHVANLKTQTGHPPMGPPVSAPHHAPLAARPEPDAAKPQAEGRFLRMVKGFELHKYSDGISVGGEGRYPTILAAEKRAAELAADE